MKFREFTGNAARNGLIIGLVALLAACVSGPDKPKPTELGPNAGLLGVRQVWAAKVGATDFPLNLRVVDLGADTTDLSDAVTVLVQAKSGAKVRAELRKIFDLEAETGKDGC